MELSDHQHLALTGLRDAGLSENALILLSTLIRLSDDTGFVQIGNDKLGRAWGDMVRPLTGWTPTTDTIRRAAAALERAGLVLRLTCPQGRNFAPSVWLLRLPEER